MAAWDDDGGAPVDYADVDDDYDPQSDNPLVQPGSDGLVTQGGTDMLRELWRRRRDGASLDQIRRDAGQIEHVRVSNRCLDRAVDQGRRLEEYATLGRITEPSRRWHGVNVRSCPVCGRRVLARALRRAGCVLCTDGG